MKRSILTCSLALAFVGCGNSTGGNSHDMAGGGGTKSVAFKLTNVPSLVHPNDNVNFTLTVVDGAGNTVTNYTGGVHFDSNDGTATMPPDYTFVASDGGTQMFNAKFVTPGKWALRATDSGGVAPQASAFLIVQGPAARLLKVSGDGQTGMAGAALPQPFVVQATDTGGNPISGVAVTWTAMSGSGSIAPGTGMTGSDGNTSATATMAPAGTTYTYQAAATGLIGSPVVFTSMHGPFKLTYTDPTGGKLRLVKNAASTNTQAVLDLVVGAAAQTGYSAGFNLPIDVTKVTLNSMVPGTALSAGSATTAAKAVLPVKGPLNGVLVAAQSQKGAGTGAVTTDTVLAAGAVIFTIKLDLGPLATTAPGVVFDGTAAGFVLPSGGLRNKVGANVVLPTEVAIGKLAVTQ